MAVARYAPTSFSGSQGVAAQIPEGVRISLKAGFTVPKRVGKFVLRERARSD